MAIEPYGETFWSEKDQNWQIPLNYLPAGEGPSTMRRSVLMAPR